MMKKLILFTAIALCMPAKLFSQAYFSIHPTVTDTGSCGIDVDIKYSGMTPPFNVVSWADENWLLGTGLQAEGLCDNFLLYATLIDNNCRRMENSLFLHVDSTLQISVDTIIAVMPSAPGACDGSINFTFNNMPGTSSNYFGAYDVGVIGTSSTSFTGLCEGLYTYSIETPVYGMELSVMVDLRYSGPVPCVAFSHAAAVHASDSIIGTCNGSIELDVSGGITTEDMYQYIVTPLGPGIGNVDTVNNIDAFTTFPYAYDLCPGPYYIDYHNNTNWTWYRDYVYITDSSTALNVWAGDTVSTNTDTIIQVAVLNCNIDYTLPYDTVYISAITHLGGSQYEFTTTFVQGSDTVNVFLTGIADTSFSFMIDVTIFCDDTIGTRADGAEVNRNFIYHGRTETITSVTTQPKPGEPLHIVPNPASSAITVFGNAAIEKIDVIDISGKVLRSVAYTHNMPVNISDLPAGMYLVKSYSAGAVPQTAKFVKAN